MRKWLIAIFALMFLSMVYLHADVYAESGNENRKLSSEQKLGELQEGVSIDSVKKQVLGHNEDGVIGNSVADEVYRIDDSVADEVYKRGASLINSGLVIMLRTGSSKALVNFKEEKIDAQSDAVVPLIRNNRVLVPVRFLSEKFGAIVGYDAVSSTVFINKDQNTLKIAVGSNILNLNGADIMFDCKSELINNRLMVSLRPVAEAFGKVVNYFDGLIIVSDKDIKLSSEEIYMYRELMPPIPTLAPSPTPSSESLPTITPIATSTVIKPLDQVGLNNDIVPSVTVVSEEKRLEGLFPATVIKATIKWNDYIYSEPGGSRVKPIKSGATVEIEIGQEYEWYKVRDSEGFEGWTKGYNLNIEPNYIPRHDMPTNEDIEAFVKLKGFYSNTKYLAWVDLSREKLIIMKNVNGVWLVYKISPCTTGKNVSPTVKGRFTISSLRGSWMPTKHDPNIGAKNYVGFYSQYFFHSILFYRNGSICDPTLGVLASKGCIRLPESLSKWFYDNIPVGTGVYIR